ncbi:hypothetical protein KC19_1G307500 [Ceratodon purpureus]|uniref:Transmembrane protein n=1 Tax=Ceratodon purpureus TaxID=3225 RepID=A0A8T0JB66_CERPU|nr:hypothetical protein KC19_1G307500 [Ceratodon purpureus]
MYVCFRLDFLSFSVGVVVSFVGYWCCRCFFWFFSARLRERVFESGFSWCGRCMGSLVVVVVVLLELLVFFFFFFLLLSCGGYWEVLSEVDLGVYGNWLIACSACGAGSNLCRLCHECWVELRIIFVVLKTQG